MTPGTIGAYKTYILFPDRRSVLPLPSDIFLHRFSMWNTTTYRPTNEGCLMRQVVHPNFCSVCTEGLWLHLLKRIDLIDEISIASPSAPDEPILVGLELLSLAHLRKPEEKHLGNKERYAIFWKRDGIVVDPWTNSTIIEIQPADAGGFWEVVVEFSTPEVRKDEQGYLLGHKHFTLTDVST
jgi:hypothetical protein